MPRSNLRKKAKKKSKKKFMSKKSYYDKDEVLEY